nr:unnamed protein product [Callosobruchus analis]
MSTSPDLFTVYEIYRDFNVIDYGLIVRFASATSAKTKCQCPNQRTNSYNMDLRVWIYSESVNMK